MHTGHRTVDIHAHIILPDCLPLVDGLMAPEMEPFSYSAATRPTPIRSVTSTDHAKATDPATRLTDLDGSASTSSSISVAPAGYFYWADPELALEPRPDTERQPRQDRRRPPRPLRRLATVPMQDVGRRSRSSVHRPASDFRHVEINTNVMGSTSTTRASGRSSPRRRSSTSW